MGEKRVWIQAKINGWKLCFDPPQCPTVSSGATIHQGTEGEEEKWWDAAQTDEREDGQWRTRGKNSNGVSERMKTERIQKWGQAVKVPEMKTYPCTIKWFTKIYSNFKYEQQKKRLNYEKITATNAGKVQDQEMKVLITFEFNWSKTQFLLVDI